MVTDFASLFKLKHTTACARLKELQDMGVVKSVGSNRDTRYMKEEFIYNKVVLERNNEPPYYLTSYKIVCYLFVVILSICF